MKFILKVLLFLQLCISASFAANFCNDIISEIEKDLKKYSSHNIGDSMHYGFDAHNRPAPWEKVVDPYYTVNFISDRHQLTRYIKNEDGLNEKVIVDHFDIDDIKNFAKKIDYKIDTENYNELVIEKNFLDLFLDDLNFLKTGDQIITINDEYLTFENALREKYLIKHFGEYIKNKYQEEIDDRYDGDVEDFLRLFYPMKLGTDLMDHIVARDRFVKDFAPKIIGGCCNQLFSDDKAMIYLEQEHEDYQRPEFRKNANYQEYYENYKLTLGIYRAELFSDNHEPSFPDDLFFLDIVPQRYSVQDRVRIGYHLGDIRSLDVQNNLFNADYKFSMQQDNYDLGQLASKISEKDGSGYKNSYESCNFSKGEKGFEVLSKVSQPSVLKLNQLSTDTNKYNESYSLWYFTGLEQFSFENRLVIEKIEEGNAQFSMNFDYASFPFDTQKLSIGLEFNTAGYILKLDDPVSRQEFLSSTDLSNSLEEFKKILPGWSIKGDQNIFKRYHKKYDHSQDDVIFQFDKNDKIIKKFKHDDLYYRIHSRLKDTYTTVIINELELERNYKYFLFKIIAPIILILVVCWSIFWTPSRELESRLTVTITCFLALVAYTFVIDDDLPKLSYLTLMDYIILVSYFYAAMPTILSVISHKLYNQNKLSNIKLDYYAKFLGPITYMLLIYAIIFGTVSSKNSIPFLKAITFQ